jgi:hypothetical protein
VRELRGVPEACPDCGAPDLEPEQGENTAAPAVLWERPRCPHCGWAGRAVPILDMESGQAIITRKGETSDQHGIMMVPLRGLRKPGDPPVEPLKDVEIGPPEPTEYFAYGSMATLPGHELRFHKRSKKDKSAKCDAFATGDDDSACIGVLFSFDPAERADLDLAEGAGKGYDAKVVTVINSQGRRRKVLTYLASPDAIDDTLKPYSWYKNHVLAGAKEHSLPPDYVAEWIEPIEAVEDPDAERDREERAIITPG